MAPAPTDAPDKENELNSKEMSTAELKETKTAAIATSSAAGKAKVQAPPPLLDVVKSASARAVEMLRDQISTTGLRLQKDVIFSTLEDFERADPDAKRMVVIGVTGAGKSTVLNCLGGWEFKQKPPDYEFEWQDKDGVSPLFEARADTDSCTKKTSFANLSWCGDESRPVVAVDTPGHDDPAGAEIENAESREKLGELAADLHNKLKALGHVHAILVPPQLGRRNPPCGRPAPRLRPPRPLEGFAGSPAHFRAPPRSLEARRGRSSSPQAAPRIKGSRSRPAPQVLHNDVHSNRLNPATYTILKMVGEKFLKSEVSCWRHARWS